MPNPGISCIFYNLYSTALTASTAIDEGCSEGRIYHFLHTSTGIFRTFHGAISLCLCMPYGHETHTHVRLISPISSVNESIWEREKSLYLFLRTPFDINVSGLCTFSTLVRRLAMDDDYDDDLSFA